MEENVKVVENVATETAFKEKQGQVSIVEDVKTKKVRHRKKSLHTAIRNQMEFYFSNANLSKDRFMQNAIKEGSEVKLEIFLSFNKIRTLSEDLKEIVKALKFSSKLKVSEDETAVSRIEPFLPRSQEEVDNSTIYVEQLPLNANHEWLTKVFSEFGRVAYVSLPKFKDLTKIKGFAFVEFDSVEDATKAVHAYSTPESYSKFQEDPGQLCSIHSFNAESQEKCTDSSDAQLRLIDENRDDGNEPQKKKLKLEEVEKKTSPSGEDGILKETEKKDIDSNHKEEVEPKIGLTEVPVPQNQEAQLLSLQVMSKKNWKKLRNKYLDMQRKSLREMKMNLMQEKYYNKKYQKTENVPSNEAVNTPVAEIPAEIQEPGLIIKIMLEKPIEDAKLFKNQVKCHDGVSYVEAEDCHTEAFVRCTDSKAAQALIDKKIWSKAEVLEGIDEKEYWRKIEQNRIKKRERLTRPKKSGAERARQKKEIKIDLPQSSHPSDNNRQHMRFSEEEPCS